MIWRLLSITNNCIGKTIEFSCNTWCQPCCTAYWITRFDWAWTTRTNTVYNYWTINWWSSTCFRDEVKIIDLTISVVEQNKCIRWLLRQKVDQLMGNYDCCDTCCPFIFRFEDDSWQMYEFDAKVGTSKPESDIEWFDIVNELSYKVERCWNEFINTNEKMVCWELWTIDWFTIPYQCLSWSCRNWSKNVIYNWSVCWSYRVEINWEGLVNPRFTNLTTWWFYELDWTYDGNIVLDSATGQAIVNGTDTLNLNATPWSGFKNLKFRPWVNEIMLSAQWGTWEFCAYYSDNIS